MRKILTVLTLTLFAALMSSSIVKLGKAGSISVGTYDAAGVPREVFLEGEEVRIIAESTDSPITITVTDPDGIIVLTETYYGYIYNKTLGGLTEKSGWYTVEAASPIDQVRRNYASTYFNVIPEVPFGTITAATAGLFALGFYGLKRSRKQLIQIK